MHRGGVVTGLSLQVREPAGERELGLPCAFGGSPSDPLRIPGVDDLTVGVFEQFDGGFGVRFIDGAPGDALSSSGSSAGRPRLNGRSLAAGEFHELFAGDLLSAKMMQRPPPSRQSPWIRVHRTRALRVRLQRRPARRGRRSVGNG